MYVAFFDVQSFLRSLSVPFYDKDLVFQLFCSEKHVHRHFTYDESFREVDFITASSGVLS